jgi:hypothetical protein
LINSKERGEEIQQDDNEGSTSIIADNASIDNDQKPHNSSSSSYEDNNEEWLMKRAKKAFAASAEDEDDWLFKRARLSFAASAEEGNDENKKHSSDPMEVTTKALSSREQQDMQDTHESSSLKAYMDEVLAEMKKLDRGKTKMKTRYKGVGTTAKAIMNREKKM